MSRRPKQYCSICRLHRTCEAPQDPQVEIRCPACADRHGLAALYCSACGCTLSFAGTCPKCVRVDVPLCAICQKHRIGSSCANLPLLTYNGLKIIDDARTCAVHDPDLAGHLNIAADAQREGAFDRADEILRAVIAEHPLNVLPVEVLCPLPVRVTRVFVAAEDVSASLATLVQCEPANMHWREFGPTSLARLGERMRALGLNLAGQSDYAWIKLPKRSKPVTGALNRLLILPTFITRQDA